MHPFASHSMHNSPQGLHVEPEARYVPDGHEHFPSIGVELSAQVLQYDEDVQIKQSELHLMHKSPLKKYPSMHLHTPPSSSIDSILVHSVHNEVLSHLAHPSEQSLQELLSKYFPSSHEEHFIAEEHSRQFQFGWHKWQFLSLVF